MHLASQSSALHISLDPGGRSSATPFADEDGGEHEHEHEHEEEEDEWGMVGNGGEGVGSRF